MTIAQAFQLALHHHQSGRLAEAEALYRQILAAEPRHAEALHHLGIIARQAGRDDVAVKFIRQAIALAPNNPEAHFNLGTALYDGGHCDEAIATYRQAIALNHDYSKAHGNLGVALYDKRLFDEAIAAYRQAIALNPGYPEACYNLGIALYDKGCLDEAAAAFRQAIALKPHYPEAHINLGNALKGKGQRDEAIAAYRQAIALNPNYPEAHNNLGNSLIEEGLLDEAIAACRQAIALKPNYPEAHNNLGNALKEKGQLDEAIAAYHRVIALQPEYTEAHSNLGGALKEKGQLDEAIAAYRRVIALQPGSAEAHSNLGSALYDKRQLDEAIAEHGQAIALQPELPAAHFNLALPLLLRGDFHRGWEEYEWRLKVKNTHLSRRKLTQPQWDGGPLKDDTLLLHAEQGFGDAMQFIRYLPMAAQRAGKIIVECQAELQRLIQAMAPDLPVMARTQALPAFDVHCPLLSLPRIFATDLGSIPRTVPYLRADDAETAVWRARLDRLGSSLKVGLAWSGNPDNKNDRNRSLELASVASLAEVPGVRFISMQKGVAVEAWELLSGLELLDVSGELRDFADTAALIANLDLVITVDTAVAHLAGAMGKPVWTLLPFAPDWRWLLKRSDSPWYPTMRLFRQPRILDWAPVTAEVREQLQALVESRRRF